MKPPIDKSEVEEKVRSIFQDMYGPDKRDDIVEGVTVEVNSRDGEDHSVSVMARRILLEKGKVYRWEKDGYNFDARVEAIGMGGSHELTVRVR